MASCTTAQWASTAPQLKLTVSTKSSTDTSVTYSWTLQYIASSAASTSTARSFTAKIDGATVYNSTYSINGKKGTYTVASGTKTISKGTSARTVSFSCTAAWKLTWSGSYCASKSASGTFSIAKKTSYTISYNANGGSGAPSSQTKWYGTALTLSSTKPIRSGWTFMGWGTSATDTSVDYAAGASYTANSAKTLYAIWRKTLTLTYSANGGTGGPGSASGYIYNASTSYTFTISSTQPTKSGYSFLGWSTSNDTSVEKYAGNPYAISSNVTLYAVWRKTITISYNMNGGSGSISAQTGYAYNAATSTSITVSSTKPTKTYYNFLGWSTSKSATSATYKAGTAYSFSSSVTLYAVWEIAYIKPRITNVSVLRCDENGYPADDGTYALVNFNWATDQTVSSVVVTWSSDGTYTVSDTSGTSGVVGNLILGDGAISIETKYTFTITVTDTMGSNSVSVIIPAMAFLIDFLNGGKGISIGKPASKEGFECDFETNFNKKVYHNDYSVFKKAIYVPNAIMVYAQRTDGTEFEALCFCSGANNTTIGYGSCAGKVGITKVFGNTVEITSNSGVSVAGNTSITGTLTVTSHVYDKGHHYFANGTAYYISNAGGARLASVTGVGTDNWLGKHRFCGEWIGMYNTANGGTRKGYIGHDGSTHLYVVNENGGSTYYNTGANHYFNKGVLISSGNLGSKSAYTSGFAMYGIWKDGANHDIVGKSTDGLGCFLGWTGSSSYATVCTIRGRTCRYTNSSGTTNLSDRNLKKDFEGFSDAHDIFFDKLNPTTYKYILGSSGRSHFGYITQEVEEALEEAGLTTKDFGGVNIVKLTSRETEKDDVTGEVKDIEDSADNYLLDKGIDEQHNLVYTEFISLNTWQIQKLKKRVNEQDEEIANLKSELSELKSLVQQLLDK